MRRIVVFLVLLAIGIAALFLSTRGPSQTESVRAPLLTDQAKADIIHAILKEAKKEDHAVTELGELYVYVPDEIFALLPKEVNGIQIKQLTFGEYNRGFKEDYLVFREWKESETGMISVANVAFFAGGNAGGCNYNFKLEDGHWKEDSRKCHASGR